MEDQADSVMVSKALELMPGSDSKLVGLKRSIDDLVESHEILPKRIKMRDLASVIHSEETNAHGTKSLERKQSSLQLQFGGEGVSQVTEVPVSFKFFGSQVERTKGEIVPDVVRPVSLPLDLNTEICVCIDENSDNNPNCEENFDKLCSQESNCGTSKGIGLDLNAEDVSSLINHEAIRHKHVLKPKDVSECASSIGPVEEKDPLCLWKEMKQNGFLSTSHGSIPMQKGILSSSHGGISVQTSLLSSSHGGIPVPKQRGRKSKNDVLKKKMELAKKEQVDKFTRIAAPSGLLNGLNPGIINHVRNRKQVHSIIEALVKSEKLENMHSETKQAIHVESGTKDDNCKKDHGNMDDLGFHHIYHEDGSTITTSMNQKARGYLVPMQKTFSSISVDRSGAADSSKADLISEDGALELKLSSSTKESEKTSSLPNEESANVTSASSLSVKAATVASQWLELLQQDIKGRLLALRRSKKKVRAVITTELPFLISKEFSSNQGSDPNIIRNSADGFSLDATAEMHRARWSALFDQMDKALSEEEKELESWLNQIKGMQLHCDQGLQHMHLNVLYALPQLGRSENNIRLVMGDSFDKELAVRAAAASIYSTCDFMLSNSKENVPCSLI